MVETAFAAAEKVAFHNSLVVRASLSPEHPSVYRSPLRLKIRTAGPSLFTVRHV